MLLSSPSGSSEKIINFVFSLIGALGFFIFAYLAIKSGHFHEDAYILFKYVENIVAGNGISFSPDLGPAEGATDFLWLMLLSGLHSVGFNVGTSAIIANSIGVFITLFFMNRLSDGSAVLYKVLLCMLAWTILLSDLTLAAAGGFSVWAYTATIVPIFYLYLKKRHSYWYLIPLLSLILGLIRPDGVIIGAAASLLVLYDSRLFPSVHRQVIVSSTIAFVVGMSYFAWRFNYFGTVLPLPLLVKAETSYWYQGWPSNLSWIRNEVLLILWAIVSVFLLIVNSQTSRYISTVLKLSIPFALHLTALGFALQSQNVGHRFQAPETIFIFGVLLFSLAVALKESRLWIRKISSLTGCALGAWILVSGIELTRQNFRHIANHSYINVFPVWFNQLLSKDTLVAITEAGRLPYWASNYRYIDLVGLNTTAVARDGLTKEYIEANNPDVFFIWYDTGSSGGDIKHLSVAELERLNNKNKQELVGKRIITTTRASILAADYLVESKGYDLISVRYWNSRNHLFAFRKGLVDIDLVKRALKISRSLQLDYGYFDLHGYLGNDEQIRSLFETKI